MHAVEVEQQRLDKRINNLVKYGMSASIFHHLCGIALLHEYKYSDEKPFEREMYFLRDNGFIRPKSDAFLDFDYRMNQQNLVQKVKPTEIGWDCIRLRKDEIPQNMLEAKNNLRIDPSTL